MTLPEWIALLLACCAYWLIAALVAGAFTSFNQRDGAGASATRIAVAALFWPLWTVLSLFMGVFRLGRKIADRAIARGDLEVK